MPGCEASVFNCFVWTILYQRFENTRWLPKWGQMNCRSFPWKQISRKCWLTKWKIVNSLSWPLAQYNQPRYQGSSLQRGLDRGKGNHPSPRGNCPCEWVCAITCNFLNPQVNNVNGLSGRIIKLAINCPRFQGNHSVAFKLEGILKCKISSADTSYIAFKVCTKKKRF